MMLLLLLILLLMVLLVVLLLVLMLALWGSLDACYTFQAWCRFVVI